MKASECIAVRAVRTEQGAGTSVFAFFLPGHEVLRLADIDHIKRGKGGKLVGFQRKAIKSHIASIVDYLDKGPGLFPNAIILAIAPECVFRETRGASPHGLLKCGVAGTLSLPAPKTGSKKAWIVDGQQRAVALSRTSNRHLPVPVIAFVSSEMKTHREQFIVVNKARPLSPRLIDELLPEIDTYLPPELQVRKLPSALCNLLNDSPQSPFHGLIKRESDEQKGGIINQGAVINMISDRIMKPRGALSVFKTFGGDTADAPAMFKTLILFWSAVKAAFPGAWGLPPARSRLMHSAGIQAMGELMDQIMARAVTASNQEAYIRKALKQIAPKCAWTGGQWPDLGLSWNQVEVTAKGIGLLKEQLVRLDHFENATRSAS